MNTYEFTLVLTTTPTEAEADTLYGICTDGTLVGSGVAGYVRFHCEAGSLEEALRSALADVRAAGFTVERVEMEPDAVPLAT